jgi:predicted transcriptional regulator
MLGLTQAELAKNAGISTTGLNNIERGSADPKTSTLRAIQAALESAGVEFTNGGQPGVRLRKFRSGDIVRARQAGHVSGIRVEKGQTGVVTVVEVDTEQLGSKYRVTVRFEESIPLPLSAADLELVEAARN